MKAVLFDIDGTLVRFDGAGRRALVDAACRVTRLSTQLVEGVVDGIDFRGNTDALIVEEIARGLDVTSPRFASDLLRTYVTLLGARITDTSRELMPGVIESIELLSASEQPILVGCLTGNIREGARIKLEAIGLGHLTERPGGYGDDGRRRNEIAEVAVGRLRAAGVSARDVFVVGDTEHDVAAARAAGARAVAVATGWTPRRELERSGPDALLDDLSDPEVLYRLVVGGGNS